MRRRVQINPEFQEILPGFTREDVFGGSLHVSEFVSSSGLVYDGDCATQCLLHILGLESDVTYDAIAASLREKKSSDDVTKSLRSSEKREWMSNHLSPTIASIRKTLNELSCVEWLWWCARDGYARATLRDFAWANREVPALAVVTNRHITAVIDGIIHDGWNSMNYGVTQLIYPKFAEGLIDFDVESPPHRVIVRRKKR